MRPAPPWRSLLLAWRWRRCARAPGLASPSRIGQQRQRRLPAGAASVLLAVTCFSPCLQQDGFMHIGLQAQPVQQHEVSQALTQLAALGGVDVEPRR